MNNENDFDIGVGIIFESAVLPSPVAFPKKSKRLKKVVLRSPYSSFTSCVKKFQILPKVKKGFKKIKRSIKKVSAVGFLSNFEKIFLV